MKLMIINTRNEILKLLAKKKYIIICALGVLVSFGVLGVNLLVTKLSGGEITIRTGIPAAMLRFVTDILVPVIVFMGVTDLFAAQIQENTMKASLMLPISRLKIMISKSLAVFCVAAAVMVVMFFAGSIIQMFSGRGFSGIPATFAAYIIDMIPVFALIAFSVLINVAAKSPTLSMLLCILGYVVLKCMNYYVTPYGQMVFTAYSQWHRLWLGAALPIGTMLSKIGILFGSVLILYALSYIVFEEQDY